MNIIKEADFRKEIKVKPQKAYLFFGEEDYLKKYYLKEIRSKVIVDEVFATFNHSAYDGADIDFASVAEAIKSPPMMSDYKLIEWRFANLDAMKEGERRRYMVRIRYRQPLQGAELICDNDGMYILFDEPQRGITAGQFAAWYDGEVVKGSGVIEK